MKWTTYKMTNGKLVKTTHYLPSGVVHNPPCSTEKCRRRREEGKKK